MWWGNSVSQVSCSPRGVLGPGVRPRDRRGGERIGRAGQRDVALAGEQPRGRVEADPAGAGKVDLGPGVQVGEVGFGPRGAVERCDVGLELDQVSRDEPGGQAELPQDLHQQPGRVAARAAAAASSVSSQVWTPGSRRIR